MPTTTIRVDQHIVDQSKERGFASPNQYFLHLINFEEKNIAYVSNECTDAIIKSHSELTDLIRKQDMVMNLLMNRLNLQLDITDLERKFLDQMIKSYSEKK